MSNKIYYQPKFSIIYLVVLASFFACKPMIKDNPPPVAPKIPHEITHLGKKWIDNYFWMRERDSKEILDYLNQENEYTAQKLKNTEGLQKELFEEITGRIKKDDNSVPYLLDRYYYYVKFEGEQEYPLYCRKKESLEADEEIMLDVNLLAEGKDFYNVAGLSISPNGNYLAFGEDTLSRRIYTIKFLNLENNTFFIDELSGVSAFAAWSEDGKYVFYTAKDLETLRTDKIFRHKMGTSQEEDVLIYEEKDETFTTYVSKLKSKKYLVIHNSSSISDEYLLLNANSSLGDFKMFESREREHEYGIDHIGNSFYITTNWNAKNFRLMKCSEENTAKENWEEVIPHREDVMLEDFELFNDFLVLDERKDGLSQFRVINNKSGASYYIDFGSETYSAYIGSNYQLDSKVLRYGFNSLTQPNSVIEFDLITQQKTILKQEEVVGGYNGDLYESKRVWVESHDGTKVPISIVYKKELYKEGQNPLLLYGYGSYGYSIDPYFSTTRLSLLDRGFVYAIAHVRGGEYLGRDWYDDGKMLQKKNTFLDFIACGEAMVEKKFCAPNKLYAMGGSAGGLLMGAVINMKPEIWNGIIAAVPFVDVINTMLDESIPLTTGEFDEWGNPKEKEYFEYMLGYSPYDNVEAKAYPNMLVTSGYHDSQVQYWEPTKWVAKLRELKTDDNLLLLHTNMAFGHSGASGRFESYKETAMEYAFLLMLEENNKKLN